MAPNNLIKKETLANARIREVDFALKFEADVKAILAVLGGCRLQPKRAGETINGYRAVGTLGNTNVGEGETIPLSAYSVEKVPLGDIVLQKRAKGTSAEAILQNGFEQAVNLTSKKMGTDATKKIKDDLFTALGLGTGVSYGSTLQATLANAWAQLQILFEDTESTPVHFVNPLDVASYLGSASITTQSAFGFKYVEDFLGLGTVFIASGVPQGTVFSTARDNVILSYIDVNDNDLGEVFDFTTDDSGFIGIHEAPNYDNMTALTTVIWGVKFTPEMIDGVVVSEIDSTPLDTLTVTSVAGTASGDTKVTVAPTKASKNKYFYYVDTGAKTVAYGDTITASAGGWTAWNGTADITATTDKVITVVECNSANKVLGEGHATVVAKA